jgi:hypothetical protein
MVGFKRKISVLLLVVLASLPQYAFAQNYLENFRGMQKSNNDIAMVFLKGLADGIVNTAAYPGFQAFCLPPDMPLGPEVLLGLLNDHVATTKLPIKDDDTVSYLAVRAVKEAFPCR